MKAVEILADSKGGHCSQECNIPFPLLEGWAVIPDDMETPNFPYGEVEVEEINGVMTVTKWIEGVIPEPIPETEKTNTPVSKADKLIETLFKAGKLTEEEYNEIIKG